MSALPLLIGAKVNERRRIFSQASYWISPVTTGSIFDLASRSIPSVFTRASTTTFFNKSGVLATAAINEPVIEYDPATGTCLGLRIWDAATNLYIRSEEFESIAWSKYDTLSVTADQALSPSGALTADLFSCGAVFGYMQTISSFVSGQVYTFSVFLKAGTATKVVSLLYSDFFGVSGSNVVATWDLSSGVATLTGGLNASASMQNCRNGWYRCALTTTATATGSGPQQFIRAFTLNSNFYAWGAQLNTGPLAPYVPTAATTVSTAADVMSITGSDFTRIWNQVEDTMYFDGYIAPRSGSNFPRLLAAVGSNADTDVVNLYTRVGVGTNDGKVFANTVVGGVNQADLVPLPGSATGNVKSAFAFKVNDFALCNNGIPPSGDAVDTNGILPTVNQLKIYGTAIYQAQPCGYIRELAIFRSRRNNRDLILLTQ